MYNKNDLEAYVDRQQSSEQPKLKNKYIKEVPINIVCFVLLGWTNNFAYNVMLSAAEAIIGNAAPTSAVLLCDILPAFII